ncbi:MULTISPECIES: hypothetical protein [Paenibacillus]|uniref:hypothetical protein n=1 Tax=Paenibacillus TaxID=44249 RepID=UPI0022B87F1A|nr:hypothetical protein [Paenibacillus caseinilyticus]MCZ8521439.1 hypothetical protein [Paenibacillus caseinilyticus]
MTLWDSELKQGQLRIAMNPASDSLLVQISSPSGEKDPLLLELNQSEMLELLHMFLRYNRSFNRETMYFEEAPGAAGFAMPASGE